MGKALKIIWLVWFLALIVVLVFATSNIISNSAQLKKQGKFSIIEEKQTCEDWGGVFIIDELPGNRYEIYCGKVHFEELFNYEVE